MSRVERLKEEIGWLRVVFGIAVVTDISLIAWLVQNAHRASSVLRLACLCTIVGVTLGVGRVNRIAYRKIDELEGL